ncbi:MAG: DUF4242 domain-containing protein [Bacteroidota bacterium]|nr:DUF4242 domain-containing protein [Bacteroidota bacterium]
MPIYMDRHNLSASVTAENVAHIHQEDLKIQDQYGCRGLTYWFDDIRKTAFCLIDAPDEEALKEMHRVAHGDVPHIVIEVEPNIVESFLGRIEDPLKAQNSSLNIINDPAFRTIMLMVLDKSVLNKNNSPEQKIALDKFNDGVSSILKSYAGAMVKQGERQWLVSFNCVSNGVHAAIDIHALFKCFIKEAVHKKINLKTGISAGAPVTEKKLIFEDCIKSAERMCSAINGDIIISPEVKDLYNNENTKALDEEKTVTALTYAEENFLNLLMDFTEEHWSDVNLKAEDFCRPLGCSKSQVYRKMIRLTGKSPNTFIKEYRLSAALQLLHDHSRNISEIAFETGFSSPSYFSKCFQKRYGYVPSEYFSASTASNHKHFNLN